MRLFLFISLFFVSLSAISQVDTNEVKSVIQKLDQALINQDSTALDLLLDGKLSYGHSNGWIQDKKAIWTDFKTGKVSYSRIANSQLSMAPVGKEWVTVRMLCNISGTVEKKEFELNLHVLQVWKKDKKGWQLVARQSTKL